MTGLPTSVQKTDGEGTPLALQIKVMFPPSMTVPVWGTTSVTGATEIKYHKYEEKNAPDKDEVPKLIEMYLTL